MLEFKLVNNGTEYSIQNTEGSDRKKTGSYYTPDYMVNYIVKESLSSFVKDKTSNDILKIKVLDPACGSGHFLLGAVSYLENKIIEIQSTDEVSMILSRLIKLKRR